MSAQQSQTPPPAGKVYRWVTFGVPELLVSDNGRDFTSRYLRETANQHAMSLQFTPVKTPRAKGTVERTFGTFNTRFLHRLTGTTLGKQTAHLGYNAATHAVHTLPGLKRALEHFIVTVHNPAVRSRKYRSANDLFVEGIQRHPPRMPSSESDLDGMFGLIEHRVVQQYGIQYRYLLYQSAELIDVFHTSKSGTTLSFSVDITDVRSIRVQHPVTGRFFIAKCVRDLGSAPYSLDRYLAVLGLMKKRGLNPRSDHDHALAERVMSEMIERMNNAESKRQARANLKTMKDMEGEGIDASDKSDGESFRPAGTRASGPEVVSPTTDVVDNLDTAWSRPL